MAYKIKIDTKRRLKEPDKYVSIVERVIFFSKKNLKFILIVSVVLLALGIAYAGIMIKMGIDDKKALKLEYEASHYYFGTDSEKRGEDLKKAIEIYQRIISDYKRSRSSPIAGYYLGNVHMELKEYDAAISVYNGLLERYPHRSDLIPLVYQRLGYAYLAKGDNKNALESFNRTAKLEMAKNRDQSLFESGRILEVMGEKGEARKKYKEIVTSYPSSPFSAEAQVKIKALVGDSGTEESKKDDHKGKK